VLYGSVGDRVGWVEVYEDVDEDEEKEGAAVVTGDLDEVGW